MSLCQWPLHVHTKNTATYPTAVSSLCQWPLHVHTNNTATYPTAVSSLCLWPLHVYTKKPATTDHLVPATYPKPVTSSLPVNRCTPDRQYTATFTDLFITPQLRAVLSPDTVHSFLLAPSPKYKLSVLVFLCGIIICRLHKEVTLSHQAQFTLDLKVSLVDLEWRFLAFRPLAMGHEKNFFTGPESVLCGSFCGQIKVLKTTLK